MQKLCDVFEIGLDFFLDNDNDKYTFNKIEKNNSSNIGCKIDTINNNFPEGVLENIIKRIEIIEKKFK